MRKESFLFFVGLLIFISPLLAVPLAWKDPYLFVLGGLVVFISFSYRLDARRRERRTAEHASFVEHNPAQNESESQHDQYGS